jgi:hypothetical protein
MRLAFLDDSQQTEPPRQGLGHLLALGAAIVPEEHVAGYATDLISIRTKYGIPAGQEIKWNAPKGSFLAGAGADAVKSLRRSMLEAAIERQIRTVVVIVDHAAAYTSYSEAEVGREILRWLYERVSMHLADHDDIGIMIADKPGGGHREDSRWLAETLQLTSDGTEYVTPGRIVLPIVTAHSHHLPHLQLADLVVAATTAAIAGRQSGLSLGPLLAKLMHRHKLGDANGAGIVLWPRRYNLLYHAFGETGASLPSQNSGVTLPYPEWSYAADDGLATGGFPASSQAPGA